MRPVVVLSHEVFNQRSGTVIAMAVTSQPQRASFPLTMELKKVRLPKTFLGEDPVRSVPCRWTGSVGNWAG